MIPLVFAVAVLFQQQVAQRPTRSPSSRDSATTESRQAIMDVGRSVAEMRTAHEALRRAAFNSPDAMVVQRAQEMRQRCQDLTAVARTAAGRLCRTCFSATVQSAINGYRAVLPGVGQVGTRCSSQIAQFLRARTPTEAVRGNIWSVGRTVVDGMVPYEDRLRRVREAFGLTPASGLTPRR